MNYKVTYYDIESDSRITKTCYDFQYPENCSTFKFTPVDDPVTIYKSIVIDRPLISIYQTNSGVRITVEGYQYIKSGGYWKTDTIIECE